MKYERLPIDPGPFSDIMPDGAELFEAAQLPTIELRTDRAKYKVPDMRLIHPSVREAISIIIYQMATEPGIKEAFLYIRESLYEDEDEAKYIIEATQDALLSFNCGGTFYRSGSERIEHVVDGVRPILSIKTESGESGKPNLIRCETCESFAFSAYRYFQEHQTLPISLIRLLVYAVDNAYAELEGYMKQQHS